MLTHRGFSAWIVVDGRNLSEYLVAVDTEAHRVSCWIPGEEGQTFTVYWRDHGGKVDTCAFITLDGFVVPGRFLFGEGIASRQGVRSSKAAERPFMFQKVEGNDSEASSQTVAKDAGMISLRIKRIDRVSSRAANPVQEVPETILGKRKVGELRVGFGEETPAYEQYSTTWSIKPHDQDVPGAKKPSTYVSFVFRYRSREFLEAQGILTEVERPQSTPKRLQVRRVASLPLHMPSSASPSPSPPVKRQKLSTSFMRIGAQRPRRPAETRRTVSWKALTTRPEGFPGEGILKFNEEPEQEGTLPNMDDLGSSGTEATTSQ